MLTFNHATPSLEDVRIFFYRTDNEFNVPLSQRVHIEDYTLKLYNYADFFVCYDNEKIVGMLCCYMNCPPEAYISHVCVCAEYQGAGIFSQLYRMFENECIARDFFRMKLEVDVRNEKAKNVYKRIGFVMNEKVSSFSSFMTKNLCG